ncbi:MAG TPA: ABC transporter permease [Dehalococcoidia bacterium]|nr:ABC transporter permease [Dehalococcoidia bacterium]
MPSSNAIDQTPSLHVPDVPPKRVPSLVQAAGRATAQYLPAIALLIALIFLWEFLVRWLDTRPYLLPAPSRIWDAFVDVRDVLPRHVRATMYEAIVGLIIAAASGAVLAGLIATIPLVRRVLYPIVIASQTIPIIVLAPLLVTWFGFGLAPKVTVVALAGFFPVVVSTADGLMQADRELIGLVRSMGGGRYQVMRFVLVPSALPSFFAGMKIAAAYAMLAAIIGEWVGAREGLGVFITRSQASFRTDQIFVAIAIIALASMALFAVVTILARIATPWMYIGGKEDGER